MDLGAAATEVTKALNDLLNHIKQGTGPTKEVMVFLCVYMCVCVREHVWCVCVCVCACVYVCMGMLIYMMFFIAINSLWKKIE